MNHITFISCFQPFHHIHEKIKMREGCFLYIYLYKSQLLFHYLQHIILLLYADLIYVDIQLHKLIFKTKKIIFKAILN